MAWIFAWCGETVGPMQMHIQGEGKVRKQKKDLEVNFL